MKSLIRVLFILFVAATGGAAFPFQDKTAVTDDGKKVILKPDGTWSYIEAGGAKVKEKADEYADASMLIEQSCKENWPEDFSVRAYCEKKQRDAVKKLKLGKPPDIADSDYAIIHRNCAKDWPGDFSVRHYCEQKQFDALRELRKK